MSKLKVIKVIVVMFIVATIAIVCFQWAGDTESAKPPQYTYVLLEEAGVYRLHRTTKIIQIGSGVSSNIC